MSLQEARKRIPELNGLSDESALNVIHQVYYPNMPKAELASRLGYTPPKVEPEFKSPGLMRNVADAGLALGQGAVGAGKMLSDLAGADNVVSRGFDSANEGMENLKSQESKDERAYYAQKIAEAEESGSTWDQIKAHGSQVIGMPGESIAQGIGSFATLGIGKAVQAMRFGQAARQAGMSKEAFAKTDAGMAALNQAREVGYKANVGVGAGMGVGATKGSQFEQTYNNAIAQDMPEDQAQALADEAQAYGGRGTMQQMLGGGLGVVAAKTGPIEKLIAGKSTGAGGLMQRTLGGAAVEFGTEGAQGAHERYAGNDAAIAAGVLDESRRYTGVAGQGVAEGMIGGAIGGGAGALGGAQPGAEPADQGMLPPDALSDPNAPGAPMDDLGQDVANEMLNTKLVPESGPMTRAANVATTIEADKVRQQVNQSLTGANMADMMQGPANPMQDALAAQREPVADQFPDATQMMGVDPATGEVNQPAPQAGPLDFTGRTSEELTQARKNAQDPAIRKALAKELQSRKAAKLVSDNVAPVAEPAPATNPVVESENQTANDKPAKLPTNLTGAKPNYAFGDKKFTLNFDSDIDRAAYITAQGKPSKKDAEYLKFVMDATGMTEAEVRAHGQKVKDGIKARAKNGTPGVLKVPAVFAAKAAPAAKPAAPDVTLTNEGKTDEQDQKARWLKAINDENRLTGGTGVQLSVTEDGKLTYLGDPGATQSGRRLLKVVDEARKAGATNADIAASISAAKPNTPETGKDTEPTPAPAVTSESAAPVTQPNQPPTQGEPNEQQQKEQKAAAPAPVLTPQAAPAKPKTASKEDLDHLFGLDVKRPKAIERVNNGKAYFGTAAKAKDWVKANGIKDTHEVVETKPGRFDVKAKAQGQAAQDQDQNSPQSRWTRATTNDRVGIARDGGIALRAAENVAKKNWADMDPVVQEKIAKGLQKQTTAIDQKLNAESSARASKAQKAEKALAEILENGLAKKSADEVDTAIKALQDVNIFELSEADRERLGAQRIAAENELYKRLDALTAEKSNTSSTRVDETAKNEQVTPAGDKVLGQNENGQTLMVDAKGVRYYKDGNFKISEPVRLRPTREGVETDVVDRRDEFKTVEELAADKPTPTAQPDPAKPDRLPEAVQDAIENQLRKQKGRITRLNNEASKAVSLDDKKAAMLKVTAAETTQRKLRTGIFDAEDAAQAALEAKDAALFAPHADLFPDAAEAISKALGQNDELDASEAVARKIQPGEPGYTLAMAREDLQALHDSNGGMVEDARINSRIKQMEKLIKDMQAEQAKPADTPAAKPADPDAEAKAKAQQDLDDALGDLSMILTKGIRKNMLPEQEQAMMPVLVKVMDASFRLGYYKFKASAKFVLDTIRTKMGKDAADMITLDHLQGSYISMAGKYQDKGASTKKEVIAIESLDELGDTASDTVAPPAKAESTSLAKSLYQAIGNGGMPKDNPALKKLVEAFDGQPADQARMKQAQEALETAITMKARDIVARNEGDRTTFDILLRLYASQPNLNIRTSTSIANQAYSTPAPLAFLTSRLAGITKSTIAHEPTGGNGMLMIGADPKKAIVNELNDLRIEALKAQGFTPTQKDAATQQLVPAGVKTQAVNTNPPFGSIKDAEGKPVKVKVDGFNLGQIDHLIAARALETLEDSGRGTLIIGANKVAGGLSTDDRIFFNWLYSHYNVVGHFEVDGDLYTRQGASWPVRVITINGRQKSNKISPVAGVIKRVDNWDSVYEQFEQSLAAAQKPISAAVDSTGKRTPGPVDAPAKTGDGQPTRGAGGTGDVAGASPRVVPDRAKPAPEPVADLFDEQRINAQSYAPQPQPGQDNDGAAQPTKPAGNAAVESTEGNAFQSPYTPRSSRKDEGVLIPANMAQPTQDALSRLEDEVGDIDEFARKELGYDTVADLHSALMGLQVDSVATSIYQIKQGKAVVIADQTGIGKGRQAASIIRWAAKQGLTPVFVSVKPSLFTDMYGDLADIGTNDVTPFILNGSEWVAGEGGTKLFTNKPSTHKRTVEGIAESGQLPEGSNAMFMTYSQINVDNVQRRALMALAPNAVFVLDESHNAAGASSTGEFVIGALEAAKGVVYLSATYAKRPDNMPLYFKTDIGEAAADTDGLAVAMASGGLPLQTVVSNNLVKAGQMFRRERSYDGVAIASVFDSPNRALHERMSNEATKALRAIVSADRMFHEVYVKQLADQLAESGATVQDTAGNQIEKSVQHTEFSSVVHNFVKQMLLGLKAQSAADEAIASLKRGEKPIIAVESTMGSFLNEYAANNSIGQGESLGAFDYRTILSRALARSRTLIEVGATGDKEKRTVRLDQLDAETLKAYQDAQDVIDGLTLNIPVSPIDWMRAEITRAGYKVAEITGRNLSVDYSNPEKPILSAIDETEQKDKVNTTRQFNGGTMDALILNVAGSTGISLHASEKFADQRQRHMIVAQAAGDINIFMQMLGRVHRTGQVRLPKYTILSVDLPTEKRPTAVLSIKMKSLNANTSSNTESATSVKSSDILNKYGDQIVNQYLTDNYALARALDLQKDVGEEPTEDVARKATGRLALQPIETQHAFYDEVETQYTALIDYLNKTNQNDLEPRTFDFDAEETRQEVLYEGPNKKTPFGEDAIYGEYSIKAQGTPMKPEEIKATIAENLDGLTPMNHVQKILDDLDAKFTGFHAGLEDAGKDAASVARSIGRDFLSSHRIGAIFRVDINSEPFNAVIMNVRNTHKETGNPYSLSKIQVTIAINGALRSLSVPATQFKKIEVSRLAAALPIEGLFKEQPPNQRETAKIVTGNLLAAYGELKGVRGTIITFTKQDGTSEQGILLPKLFDFGKNTMGDYRLVGGAAALKFLQQSNSPDIGRFGIASRDGVLRVLPSGQGIRVQVPKSKLKGAKYFLDKGLIEVGGDFVTQGGFMTADVRAPDNARKMLDLLIKKQALYALPSMAEEAKTLAGGDAAMFSRGPATQQAVDQWQASLRNAASNPQAKEPNMLVPMVLKMMGAKAVRLVLPRTYLKQITAKHPDVPASVFENLPEMLADPLFIIPHANGGLRAFVDAQTGKGEPIFVGVDVGVDGRINTVSPLHDWNGKKGGELLSQALTTALARPGKIYARNSEALATARASSVAAPAILALHRLPSSKTIVITRKDVVNRLESSNGNSGPNYSRGQPLKGMTKADAEDVVNGIKSRWANAPKVVVVQSMSDPDVPEAARKENDKQKSLGAKGEPEGFFYGGKAYIVAGALKSPGAVMRVLFHETLGHYGLRGTFGDGLTPILKQLAALRKTEVAAKAAQYGLDMNKEADRLTAAEEVLAEMAQSKPEIGFVKRVIALIRGFLRKNVPGFAKMQLTDADIIANYILPARKFVERGAGGPKGGGPKGGVSLSRSTGDQTETAAFKNWFGDSKVVNAEGKPLVVYRGGPSTDWETGKDITEFRSKNGPWAGFFTDKPEVAEKFVYGSGIVTPVYIRAEKPLVVDAKGKPAKDFQIDASAIAGADSPLRQQFLDGDYDALIVRNTSDEGTIYVPKDPTQIKSATGNRGTFSTTDPDIRFSRAADASGDTRAGASDTRQNLLDAIPQGVTDYLTDMTTSQRGFNRWWHRTVGTQLHKAKVNKQYRPVYYAVQDFMKDVSRMATLAADQAPDLLPMIDSLGDVKKLLPQMGIAGGRKRAANIKQASDALFDGTLRYTRDANGDVVPATADGDKGVVWTTAELQARGMSAEAIKLYEQSRLAIDQSLEHLLASDVYRTMTAVMPEQLASTPAEHEKLMATARKASASNDPQVAVRQFLNALNARASEVQGQMEALKRSQGEGRMTEDIKQALEELSETHNAIKDVKKKVDDKVSRVKELIDSGYAPLMRFGAYTVDVLDAEGARVHFGMYESQLAANQAARKFKAQGLVVSQGVQSQKDFEQLKGVSPETAMLFADMMGLEKNEAMQAWLQKAVAQHSALKRHIRRKGIEGFDDDASRVVAAFITSNSRAASRALHGMRIQATVENVTDGDVKDEAIALAEYVNNPKEEAQGLRSLLFINYIGGSVASAIVNLTQTVVQTFPFLSQYGGPAKAGKRLGAAMKMAVGKITDAELAKAVERAEADGVIKPQEVFQLQAEASRTLGSNIRVRAGLAVWGSFFQAAEVFNRRVAFIAAYQTAKEQGIDNPFAFAEDAVDQTQGVFNKGNRPDWARGAVGATLFTFKTFTIQYVEFLKRLPTKERALAMAMLVLLSGIRGLPFYEDAEDIIDTVAQQMGYNFTTKEHMDRFLVATLGDGLAQFVQHGGSTIPGMPFDVSARLGMADLLPGTGLLKPSETRKEDQVLEAFGVAGSFVRDALKGEIRPVALRNLAKGLDMYDRGIFTNTRGQKVMDVDGVDALFKGIGLQPNKVAAESRAVRLQYEKRALFNKVKGDISEGIARGMFENDTKKVQNARDDLAKWNERNPEARIVINSQAIRRRVTEMRRDRADRFIRTSPKELRSGAREAIE